MFTCEGKILGERCKHRKDLRLRVCKPQSLTDDSDALLLCFRLLSTRDSENAAFSTTKH